MSKEDWVKIALGPSGSRAYALPNEEPGCCGFRVRFFWGFEGLGFRVRGFWGFEGFEFLGFRVFLGV